VYPDLGFDSDLTRPVTLVAAKPGIFERNDDGVTPDGFHFNPGTNTYTPIADCNSGAAACPVSTGGQPNFLVLFTTGGEVLGPSGVRFELAAPGGPFVPQPVTFYRTAGAASRWRRCAATRCRGAWSSSGTAAASPTSSSASWNPRGASRRPGTGPLWTVRRC
jgi:hypothetical protein